jgi:ATP-binding cassette subfamily F protein 3
LRWLEGFLQGYPGALLVISHDHAFLDKLTTTIHSLENGDIITYTGNYSAFLEQQAARREQRQRAKQNQDKAIARTERFIERFRYKASKASQVQSRIKQLEKTERIELEEAAATVHFEFPLSRKGGHRVVKLEEIAKAYGETEVFRGFSLELQRGDRVGVVGRNGAGKSTLARLMAGIEAPDGGTVRYGHEIDVGYFAQDQREAFSLQENVYQIASHEIRATETHIRSILGAFLFHEHDLAKRGEVLSGGEKNRLALARLLLRPANFLILDEPTNHLDPASKEVLQEALTSFPGTVFVVSHDRHFLNPVVNKVLEISPGSHRWFPGNLDDYLWKLRQEEAAAGAPAGRGMQGREGETPATGNPRERRRRKAREQQRKAPLKSRMAGLETEITQLEEAIAEREGAMADKAWFERGETTASELREYDQWKADLARAMEEWETVAAELE